VTPRDLTDTQLADQLDQVADDVIAPASVLMRVAADRLRGEPSARPQRPAKITAGETTELGAVVDVRTTGTIPIEDLTKAVDPYLTSDARRVVIVGTNATLALMAPTIRTVVELYASATDRAGLVEGTRTTDGEYVALTITLVPIRTAGG
jgi:hypothetical protein